MNMDVLTLLKIVGVTGLIWLLFLVRRSSMRLHREFALMREGASMRGAVTAPSLQSYSAYAGMFSGCVFLYLAEREHHAGGAFTSAGFLFGGASFTLSVGWAISNLHWRLDYDGDRLGLRRALRRDVVFTWREITAVDLSDRNDLLVVRVAMRPRPVRIPLSAHGVATFIVNLGRHVPAERFTVRAAALFSTQK